MKHERSLSPADLTRSHNIEKVYGVLLTHELACCYTGGDLTKVFRFKSVRRSKRMQVANVDPPFDLKSFLDNPTPFRNSETLDFTFVGVVKGHTTPK